MGWGKTPVSKTGFAGSNPAALAKIACLGDGRLEQAEHIARVRESLTLVREMGNNLFDRAAGKFLYGALWHVANAVCDHDAHVDQNMSAATDKGSKLRKRFIDETLSEWNGRDGWMQGQPQAYTQAR